MGYIQGAVSKRNGTNPGQCQDVEVSATQPTALVTVPQREEAVNMGRRFSASIDVTVGASSTQYILGIVPYKCPDVTTLPVLSTKISFTEFNISFLYGLF